MGRWIMTAAILAAGTVFGTMLPGGCGEKAAMTTEDVAALFGTDFTVSADITFEELQLTADLTRQGDRTAVVITSPEHLEGLTFEENAVRFKGLSVEETALPAASLGTVLDDVFDLLGQPDLLEISTDEEGKTVVSGNADGRFSLTVEGEAPLLLKMPGAGLSAEFRDFAPAEPGGTPLPEEQSEPQGASSVQER